MNKLHGITKFFNSEKGFGFIRESKSNEEYFVHATNVIDTIEENDEVSFELTEGRKGMMATNVELMD